MREPEMEALCFQTLMTLAILIGAKVLRPR